MKLFNVPRLIAHLVWELTGGRFPAEQPENVVVDEIAVQHGETLQLVRQASRAGGCYRVVVKSATAAVPSWIGPRSSRQDASASFVRLAQRIA